jgi:hypothetical protein
MEERMEIVGRCKDCGRVVFKTPHEAAVFAGGISAVDREVWDEGTANEYEQFSVLWSEDGWRGGAGGGIRTSCDGRGYENF